MRSQTKRPRIARVTHEGAAALAHAMLKDECVDVLQHPAIARKQLPQLWNVHMMQTLRRWIDDMDYGTVTLRMCAETLDLHPSVVQAKLQRLWETNKVDQAVVAERKRELSKWTERNKTPKKRMKKEIAA